MAIRVRCPGCGAVLRFRDQAMGKKGKCPKCSAVVTAAPQPDLGARAGPVETAQEGMPCSQEPVRAQSRRRRLALLLIVLLVVGAAAALTLYLSHGPSYGKKTEVTRVEHSASGGREYLNVHTKVTFGSSGGTLRVGDAKLLFPSGARVQAERMFVAGDISAGRSTTVFDRAGSPRLIEVTRKECLSVLFVFPLTAGTQVASLCLSFEDVTNRQPVPLEPFLGPAGEERTGPVGMGKQGVSGRPPVRVLGYYTARSLDAEGAVTGQGIAPKSTTDSFLVIKVSVPAGFLIPDEEAFLALKKQRDSGIGEGMTRECVMVYDPGRFKAILADGRAFPGKLVAGWLPQEREFGVDGAIISISQVGPNDPGKAITMHIAFVMQTKDCVGPFKLGVDGEPPMEVPEKKLAQ